MTHFPRAPLSTLAAALMLAGCNQAADDAADNALVGDNVALNAEMAMDEGEGEDVAAEPVAVAPLPPRPVATASAQESAPLDEAWEIDDAIGRGAGVERVRYREGWAWMRDGRIVRTADRDGRNVEYFRPGQENPFFVQRGQSAWAYDNGRPTREYDRGGRITIPDDARRREAERAERAARERREEARRARDAGAPRNDPRGSRDDARPVRPSPTPAPTATPSPAPSPTPPRFGGRDGDRDGRADPRPRPTISATPTPTPRARTDRGDGRRDDDRRDDPRRGE